MKYAENVGFKLLAIDSLFLFAENHRHHCCCIVFIRPLVVCVNQAILSLGASSCFVTKWIVCLRFSVGTPAGQKSPGPADMDGWRSFVNECNVGLGQRAASLCYQHSGSHTHRHTIADSLFQSFKWPVSPPEPKFRPGSPFVGNLGQLLVWDIVGTGCLLWSPKHWRYQCWVHISSVFIWLLGFLVLVFVFFFYIATGILR